MFPMRTGCKHAEYGVGKRKDGLLVIEPAELITCSHIMQKRNKHSTKFPSAGDGERG